MNQNNFSTTPPSLEVIPLTQETLPSYKAPLTSLYKQVFSESSWEEGYKCPACGKKSKFSQAPDKKCSCGSPMEDFYSDEEVGEMIDKVSSQTSSRIYVVLKEQTPIAFSWGWISSIEDINREKLLLSQEDLLLCKERLLTTQNTLPEKYYYLSETGVDLQYRGKKLSSLMLGTLLEDLSQSEAACILVRTSLDSALSAQLQKNNFELLYSYEDADKRVLYTKPTKS